MSNPEYGPRKMAVMNNPWRGFHTFLRNATQYIRHIEQMLSLLRWYSQTSKQLIFIITPENPITQRIQQFFVAIFSPVEALFGDPICWIKKTKSNPLYFDYLGRKNETFNLGCKIRKATYF